MSQSAYKQDFSTFSDNDLKECVSVDRRNIDLLDQLMPQAPVGAIKNLRVMQAEYAARVSVIDLELARRAS